MLLLLHAGVYNETVFKGIDYTLDQMANQGIRVIIAFIDYWKQTDGVQQARSAACLRGQFCHGGQSSKRHQPHTIAQDWSLQSHCVLTLYFWPLHAATLRIAWALTLPC